VNIKSVTIYAAGLILWVREFVYLSPMQNDFLSIII
jgi:hypothetical protein